MCMAACVFLGVFSGRELSDMMTDVTLIIHTPTDTHTKKTHTQVGRLKLLVT